MVGLGLFHLEKGKKLVLTGLACLCIFFTSTAIFAQPVQVPDSTKAELNLNKGLQLQDKGDYRLSNEHLVKAASWFESNRYYQRAAHCYNHVSSNFNLMSNLDSAETYARKGLSFISMFSGEDKMEEIRSCTLLGLIEARRADYDSAKEWLERAAGLIDHPVVSSSLQATVIGSLGYLYDDLGKYDRAISLYQQGLEMITTGSDPPKEQVAKLYNNLGYSYTNKGLYDKALAYYKKELETGLEIKGPTHPDIAGAYHNLGSGYSRKGDWGEALLYFRKSLDIVHQTVGEFHNLGALNYDNIGLCNIKLGNFEEGIANLQKAVKIKSEIWNPGHPEVAVSYKHIGMGYAEQLDYASALDFYEKAITIQQNTLGGSHPRLVDTYNKLGKYYVEQGSPRIALSYLEQAETLLDRSFEETHPAMAVTYTQMGRAQVQLGDLDHGLSLVQQAMKVISDSFEPVDLFDSPPLSSINYPRFAVNTLFEKAKILRQAGMADGNNSYLEASLASYNLLSDLLDHLQIEYISDRSKLVISEKSHTIYENAIITSYDLYRKTNERRYVERAFFFAEKSKARLMLEQMNRSNIQYYAGIPDSLVQFERQLKYQTNRVREEIDRTITKDSTGLRLTTLRDSLFTLNRRFAKHVDMLENRYPRYHRLRYETEIPSVDEMQSALGPDEAVIEYIFGKTSLFAMVVTRSHMQLHELQHSSTLEADIIAFKEAIFRRDRNLYHRKARELYKLLVQPLESDLNGITSLLIVPDKSLALMPFGALLTNEVPQSRSYADLSYLVRKHAISITPSVALRKMQETNTNRSFSTEFLAFAPVFSKDSSIDILFPRSNEDAEPPYLPSSLDEVEQIAKLFEENQSFWSYLWGTENVRLFVRKAATEKAFKRSSGDNARYIHLATHAFVSESPSNNAGIVFHADGNDEDGVLYSGEIYNLSMNADLVVLSACETGHGSVIQGEGVMGLSRAFQYAGNPNLLASLWKIDDRSTSLLMTAFYKRLLEADETKKRSLQSSQLDLIENVRFAHPYYWASFMLVGN